MYKITGFICLCFYLSLPLDAKTLDPDAVFRILNDQKQWKNTLDDPGIADWKTNWFVDGKHVTVTNSSDGMTFTTGSVEMDPAHHGVLWTKQSFSGDLKIEYDYTRLDNEHKWATMLYIQATGTGNGAYDEDIRKWSELRSVPAMKTYFNNMNLLHISYVAFGGEDKGYQADYVRARRYPLAPGGKFSTDTVVPGDYFKTSLFNAGEQYHVTVIKRANLLFLEFKNKERRRLFYWDTSEFPLVTKGRIGLRQMWRKSARYKNFKVATLLQ